MEIHSQNSHWITRFFPNIAPKYYNIYSMNLIYDIVRKLKRQEIRQVKNIIERSSFTFEKVGKLFELVTRYDERPESFYSEKLYGKPPDNTFRVTKSRLKRMLENVLLNDKSLTGYESEAINTTLQTKKKLLQGDVLLGRAAYQASKNLFLQVIASAKKFDLSEEWFQAEILMARNTSVTTSTKEYEKQTQRLLKLNYTRHLVAEAQILHYSIKNLLSNRTLSEEGKADVRTKIGRIKEIVEITDHPSARYVYYLTEIYALQIADQFEEALSFCKKYLQLIQEERSQNSPRRIAAAYVHLQQVSLQLGRLAEARAYSQEVLSRYAKTELNYLPGLELAFLIEFYSGEYEAAQALIDQAMGHPLFDASKARVARWHYLQACLHFKLGNYKAANQQLNDTAPLLADKYGMNLYIRLLEAMILYELDLPDLLDTKVLNMRQFVKRTRKDKEDIRPYALVQFLMQWYKNEYDFVKTLAKVEKYLPSPEEGEIQGHTFSSFELIKLEEWMKEKA